MFRKAMKYMDKSPLKAIALYKKELNVREYKEAWLNLGTCYKSVDQLKLAKYCVAKALDPLMPLHDNTFVKAYPLGLNNMGLLEYTFENDDAAVELYLAALKADPDNYNIKWNLAETMLRMYSSRKIVDLETCWSLYESRLYRSGGVVLKNKKEKLLAWNGTSKVDSIVVLAEQGLGDLIMFGRYLASLEQYANKITVQCAPIIAGLFSKYNTCIDPIETDATHGVPMCSLGRIFNSDIPAGDWLKDQYVRKLESSTFDIGVAWSGNSSHVNDRNRSTSSGRFLPLRDYGSLYTLNPTEHGTKGFGSLKGETFSDTITNLGKLDLVITVDTSIAHLCGALGMECWVLMPLLTTDFRWGDTSMGEDNIWYKSVKVIRNPNNWEKVFARVREKLEERKNAIS